MTLSLIGKKQEAGNACTFYFAGDGSATWTAGQYQTWILPVESDDKYDKQHWFTIASAPSESHFQITTRLTGSKFKTALDALKVGDTIETQDIEGDFIWRDTDLPKVFVAGGIGITPFRSILMDRKNKGLPLSVHLIYGNRDESYVFKSELEALQLTNPELKISYLHNGPLDVQALMTVEPNLHACLVYLSGPEPMVIALADALKEASLPEAQLVTDEFPGYDDKNY